MRKVLLGLFLLAATPAWATTYWVAKTGSDANACSAVDGEADPGTYKLTIASGTDCLSAADTLIIRAGTYTETVDIDTVIPSGTSDVARTIIRSATGETVVLDGCDANSNGIGLANKNFITFDGLVFDAYACAILSDTIQLGFGGAPCTYITIQNSVIKNGGVTGFYEGCNEGACTNNKLLNNQIFGNGFRGFPTYPHGHGVYLTGDSALVQGNSIYGNDSHGVHIYGNGTFQLTSNNIVEKNRIFSNGSYGAMISSGSDNILRNNLIYGNGVTYSAGGFRFYDDSTNGVFYNNTVYGNTGIGIHVQSGTGAVIRGNISYLNTTSNYTDAGTSTSHPAGENLEGTDPLFTAAGSADFTLTVGSPAIDTGPTLASVTVDFAGVTRPKGASYDRGAYEFQTSPTGAGINIFQSTVIR